MSWQSPVPSMQREDQRPLSSGMWVSEVQSEISAKKLWVAETSRLPPFQQGREAVRVGVHLLGWISHGI